MNFSQALIAGSKVISGLVHSDATFDKFSGTYRGVFDSRQGRAQATDSEGFVVVIGGTFSVRKALFTGTQPKIGMLVKIATHNYRINDVGEDSTHYKLTLVDFSR